MYSSDEWSESESDEDEDDKALAAVKARMGTYHQAVRDFCMCVCFGGISCGDVALAAWGLFTPKAYHPHTHTHAHKQPNTQQNHQPNSGGPAPAAVPAVGARTVAAAAAATMP